MVGGQRRRGEGWRASRGYGGDGNFDRVDETGTPFTVAIAVKAGTPSVLLPTMPRPLRDSFVVPLPPYSLRRGNDLRKPMGPYFYAIWVPGNGQSSVEQPFHLFHNHRLLAPTGAVLIIFAHVAEGRHSKSSRNNKEVIGRTGPASIERIHRGRRIGRPFDGFR